MPNTTRLIWSPEWRHRHESLWSILGKLETANVIPRESLLPDFTKGRVGLWRPEEGGKANRFFNEVLQLPIHATREAFLWDLASDNRSTSMVREALRYCPECMKSCYHSVLFQFSPLAKCPIHEVPLSDTCPRCGELIDPMEGPAWSCPGCRHLLAEFRGRTWLQGFKAAPHLQALDECRASLRGSPANIGRWASGPFSANPDAVKEFAAAESNSTVLSSRFDLLQENFYYWWNRSKSLRLAQWYQEERVALIGDILVSHLECCARENRMLAGAILPRQVKAICPAAAAILQSAALLAVPVYQPRVLKGTRTGQNAVLTWIDPLLFHRGSGMKLGEEGAELVARGFARSVLASALTSLIRTGWWDPFEAFPCPISWTITPAKGLWQFELQAPSRFDLLELTHRIHGRFQ